MKHTSIYALPGTQCTQALWSQMPSPNRLHYLEMPEGVNWTEKVAQLAQQLPDHPIELLGFSMGAYLASLFAVEYPERVEGLWLMAHTPCALSTQEINERKQVIQWLEHHPKGGVSRKKAASLFDAQNCETGIQTVLEMDQTLGSAHLLRQLKQTTDRHDLAPQLAQLSMPIRFLCAEQDAMIHRPWLQQLDESNTHVNVTWHPGRCHMLPLQYPKAVQQWLDGFSHL